MMEELKQKVYDANIELVKNGLVILTWGNVSGIDRERGIVAIKPSGVDYAKLTPDDIVLVDLDGNIVEGKLRPSSDLPTHLALYKAWDSIGGVVHTHSANATSFAQAGIEIPCFGTTHADHFHGSVPCTRILTQAEVEETYELNTGNVIIERFQQITGGITQEELSGKIVNKQSELDPVAIPGVLVAGHAPFTWGPTAKKAVENAIALEQIALMAMNTRLINPKAETVPQYVLDKHYFRKHGANAYYGQN